MDIKVPVKLQKQYNEASIWEQLFLLNYYDNKKKVRPKKDKYETLNKDIKEELDRLYSLAENAEFFKINSEKNAYLEKVYNIELNLLIEKNDKSVIANMKKNKKKRLNQLADNYTSVLFEQYKNIVNVIKNSGYNDAFKCLILNETLTKIYRLENKNILMENREINKTILEHMVLNEDVLEYVHDNISNCDSFPKLYFEAILNYKDKAIRGKEVVFAGLNTFGKGKWIKFDSKKKVSEKEFHNNVNSLKALVSDTIWCTKNEASDHLAFGDFYVFVDNEGKPHIAVKMNGRSIEEVRGILDGQRIEDEYNDVVYEFLTKNKDIPNGNDWINNQKWYEVLKKYADVIDGGVVFSNEQLNDFKKNVFDYKEYRPHGGESVHYIRLMNLIIENEYIVNHLEKYDVGANKKLSNLIKCARIVNKLKKVNKYEDLEKILMEYYSGEEYASIRDLEDKMYQNIIMDKLKEEKIINLLSSRVDKNGGKLFDKIAVKNNKNFSVEYNLANLINGAYIYKQIENIKEASELEKYVQYLFKKESLGEYRIDRLFLGEKIKDKLHSNKILRLLSRKVEQNNNSLLTEKHIKNEMLLNMINEAYIYLHLDEIQDVSKIEEILSYLYSVDGSIGIGHKCKIDDMFFKEKITQKISDEKMREKIALGFNCKKEDVFFVDGTIKNNNARYDDKILYGRVLLVSESDIEFKAKGVLGAIMKERPFDASVSKAKKVNFPNLIYCGNIVLENVETLNIDKLVRINNLNLRGVDTVHSLRLSLANKIHFINIKNSNFENLKGVNFLLINGANVIYFPSLKRVSRMEVNDGGEIDCSALIEIEESVKGKNIKLLKCSSLEKVGSDVSFENCEIDSLLNLEDVKGKISFEESKCSVMPKSKTIQRKFSGNKKWIYQVVSRLKNEK